MDTVSGIGVLDKTAAILAVVADGPVRLAELVDATGQSRATVHRLALGLEAHGLLRRDEAGAFRLGLHLVALGRAAAQSFPLARAAEPALGTLRDATGESAQLYVVDGGERLCVAAVDSPEELRTIVSVGSRLPLAVGSAGRVLSGQVGRDGWVASVGERAPGVASVSAPVEVGGSVAAAVSVSGPIARVGRSPGSRFGASVVAAATEIETAVAV